MMVKFNKEGEELNYRFYTFDSDSKPKIHQTSFLKLGKDRKSVVQGKSVDLGGRRIIKKKKNKKDRKKKKK